MAQAGDADRTTAAGLRALHKNIMNDPGAYPNINEGGVYNLVETSTEYEVMADAKERDASKDFTVREMGRIILTKKSTHLR